MNQINYNAYMYLRSWEYLNIECRELIIWGCTTVKLCVLIPKCLFETFT